MKEYRFIEATSAKELDERVNAFAVAHMTQSEDDIAVHYLVCCARPVPHD